MSRVESIPPKFNPARMRVLEEEKEPGEVRHVLDALDLQPGERMLDVGCGTGVFARPAARRVAPDGLVVGVDVQRELLEAARRFAHERGLRNLRFVESTERRMPLPPDAFDAALLANVLFELRGLHTLLETRRVLRPGARVALVDWSPAHEGPEGPPAARRRPPDAARAPLEEAGFRFLRGFDAGPTHYGLLFQQPAAAPAAAPPEGS